MGTGTWVLENIRNIMKYARYTHTQIFDTSAYAFPMFGTSPSTIMDSTTMGGPPKAAPPLLWRRPKAASIMVDGEVANIGKTYANMYRIFMYMYISHILIYFPYVIPGAISLAKSGCLCYAAFLRSLNLTPSHNKSVCS